MTGGGDDRNGRGRGSALLHGDADPPVMGARRSPGPGRENPSLLRCDEPLRYGFPLKLNFARHPFECQVHSFRGKIGFGWFRDRCTFCKSFFSHAGAFLDRTFAVFFAAPRWESLEPERSLYLTRYRHIRSGRSRLQMPLNVFNTRVRNRESYRFIS